MIKIISILIPCKYLSIIYLYVIYVFTSNTNIVLIFSLFTLVFYKQDIYDFNVIAYNLTPIFMYFIPLKLESIT